MELDGPRSSSGATDGEGVNKRANQELAPSGAVFVQDVPACGDASLACSDHCMKDFKRTHLNMTGLSCKCRIAVESRALFSGDRHSICDDLRRGMTVQRIDEGSRERMKW